MITVRVNLRVAMALWPGLTSEEVRAWLEEQGVTTDPVLTSQVNVAYEHRADLSRPEVNTVSAVQFHVLTRDPVAADHIARAATYGGIQMELGVLTPKRRPAQSQSIDFIWPPAASSQEKKT